ncbi:DUF2934 domain-containing protein [Edaphobacter bradus]|uniref:DUF2934 domain-containing protein n=1 Tax=Edaphobacter bradus TaxID=2259016 RepID=UPI0021E03532|nr:DUF2934 domain-containing protein [Edaphobacter bradus]
MSAEKTEKKPRKAPVKKTAVAQAAGETKAKAAPKAKTVKIAEVEVTAVSTKVTPWPSHEQIAMLAHRYYMERGWQDGFHLQDWLRAEQDLLAAS